MYFTSKQKSNSLATRFGFVLVLIAALSACGQARDDGAELHSDPSTSLYVSIGAANGATPAAYPLMLSAPAGYARAGFCIGNVAVCAEGQSGTYSFTPVGAINADRRFFQSVSPLQLNSGGIITIVAYGNGTQLIRKIQFNAKGGTVGGANVGTGGINWKVVLMASDQGSQNQWISAFDNARLAIKRHFVGRGIPEQNFRELSLKPKHQSATVKPASAQNLALSLQELQPQGANDACLVHMTSHGARDGFCLGSQRLAPRDLDAALNNACGDRPTVVLISACYSGLYTLDQHGLKKPNRIILTAASADKTSFGCSAEALYTYWDGCLIDNLPTSSNWANLAENIRTCIVRKEGGNMSSNPQMFIGAQVQSLALP